MREHRSLTGGEITLLRSVFADGIDYQSVRIHPARWCWPFPHNRAMAPNGHCYFAGCHAEDFAGPWTPLRQRALFVHEGAHLYQWYGLKRLVWLRGAVSRRYDYRLRAGKPYEAYGLEQMGSIAEDYYTLREGGAIRRPYRLEDYQGLLPVDR